MMKANNAIINLFLLTSYTWFFRIARKFMNPTNLSSCLSYNSTLISMKLFPLPSGSVSINQRVKPVNTLWMPFYGHSSSSGFFPSLRIPYLLSFSAIRVIFANSAALTRFPIWLCPL